MKQRITLTIDGTKVSGPPGMTILEAAEKVGIEIPRLCFEAGIKPSGNCRICVVEVEGSRTLVGSCHTPIAEGMVILSRSARVTEARQATIELLLAGHTGSCVTDTEARECRLHMLASDLEAGPPRFQVKRRRLYGPEKSPYILRDMSRCILCRKCIRACAEIAGQNLYSMAYRGFASKVVVDYDIPLEQRGMQGLRYLHRLLPHERPHVAGRRKKERRCRKKARRPGLYRRMAAARSSSIFLKVRQRTEGFLSEASMTEIACRPRPSLERGLRGGELLRLPLHRTPRAST